ncbi:MAG TPA: potassium channel family protein [Azospirillaceae bacterium]|nr:potassium channel family protein [Azospirillaceae bacterium]
MPAKYQFGFFRRRKRLVQEDLARQLKFSGVWLLLMIALHILAMRVLEGMSFNDALWLTATTIMTVGYGDVSAKTPAGRTATMLLMYGGGIFILAKAVADYAEWRSNVRERKAIGTWNWKMKNHLLLVGHPTGDVAQHVGRLVDQLRAHVEWAETDVLMLTCAFGQARVPALLADRNIVHVAGVASDPMALAKAHPEDARAILVFAPSETDRSADASVIDALIRIRELAPHVPLIVECVDQEDRPRMLRHGATQAIRAMHGYPELAARALVSPGAEELIENLFTAEGDECLRVSLDTPWRGPWNRLLMKIAESGLGTPVGYVRTDGKVITNPVCCEVEAVALFVIVDDEKSPSAADTVRGLLA